MRILRKRLFAKVRPWMLYVPVVAILLLWFGLVVVSSFGRSPAAPAMFSDIASGPLADGRGISEGTCWGDIEGDGDEDLFIANSDVPSQLWQNNGSGVFTEVAATAGLTALPRLAMGCAFVDVDNDGDLDLYVTARKRLGVLNALYRNNGDGTFSDITSTSGVAMPGAGAASADWADYDADGDYDVFVAARFGGRSRRNALFMQDAPTRFVDVAEAKGLADPIGPQAAFLGSWYDYDSDGDFDLLVALDYWGVELFRNDKGTFTRVTREAFPPATDATPGAPPNNPMGVTWGDYDNDGCVDVFITGINIHGQGGFEGRTLTDLASRLYRSNCDGTFADVTKASGFGVTGVVEWAANFVDFDNDGDLDLSVVAGNAGLGSSGNRLLARARRKISGIVSIPRKFIPYHFAVWAYRYEAMIPASGRIGPAAAMPSFLYQNQLMERGAPVFLDVSRRLGAMNLAATQTSAWADIDNDGDLDWFVANKATGNRLFRNNGPVGNHLRVHLVGASLKMAVGSRVKIKVGSTYQQRHVHVLDGYLSQSQLDPHFGLGWSATMVDEVWVRWPNTTTWVSVCKQVPANRRITVTEGQGCRW